MSKLSSDQILEATKVQNMQSYKGSGYAVPGYYRMLEQGRNIKTKAHKTQLLRQLLELKIHGISFSPYIDGQSPGVQIGEDQIRQRMNIIKEHCRWIRTFSCIEGNDTSAYVARTFGLKTMVGIGLSSDLEANEEEIVNGIDIGQAGNADILAVGNEVLLRGDLTENQLINYINRVREAVPGIPVSYVDAYFLFESHPNLVDACDLLLVNCYPFWESCAAEYSLLYMQEMYRRACKVSNGKKVIISETGWPTTGTAFGSAEPSFENALDYFIRTYEWANAEGIEIFYFSSFDESWKVGAEGDVGAYWGLWDKDGKLKYAE
ncbi:MAG: exo-beta-1,3-glucanase (GH17 family) [Gammaproteobacteria bacterium]|jgi:exo-beta-1,3-glucanase (GH17 family)